MDPRHAREPAVIVRHHRWLRGRLTVTDLAVTVGCAVLVWTLFVRRVGPADLAVFLRAAHAIRHGVSPYVDPSSTQLWSGHAFVYPYVTAWIFVPLIAVPAACAAVIYYALSVMALVTATRLLAGRSSGLVPVVLALTAEPVVRGLQLGTLNPFLLLGLALAWRYRHRRSVLVICMTLVVVAKLFLLPMVAWLVLTRRFAAGMATVVLSAGLVVAGCALSDVTVPTFVHMLSTLSAHEAPHSSSLAAFLGHLGISGAARAACTALLAAAAVSVGWLRYRCAGRESSLFCAALVACLVLSPIVWSHYFTLLLVVPLISEWRAFVQILALLVTWLLGTPDNASMLLKLHPFSGSRWVWAAGLLLVVLAWRTRSGDRVRNLHTPDTVPIDRRRVRAGARSRDGRGDLRREPQTDHGSPGEAGYGP